MASTAILEWDESVKVSVFNTYGRTPETIRQDLQNIKEWMMKQPHLPQIAEENVIINFLILNKFRMEITKKKLDMYYTVRSIIPEFYNKDPNSSYMQNFMDILCFVPLPKLTKDLSRVVIMKLKNPQADFDAIAYVAHTLNIAEIRLREECSLTEIHIYDLAGLKVSHLAKFTPTILSKGYFVLEKVFSSQPRGIHFVNALSFIDSFVAVLKKLIKPKLAARIFVHKDMESLCKLLPKNILPRDYGGDERSLNELSGIYFLKSQYRVFQKTVHCMPMFCGAPEYDSMFQHLRDMKVKEELRPIKLRDDDLLTNLHGNFRQLSVD